MKFLLFLLIQERLSIIFLMKLLLAILLTILLPEAIKGLTSIFLGEISILLLLVHGMFLLYTCLTCTAKLIPAVPPCILTPPFQTPMKQDRLQQHLLPRTGCFVGLSSEMPRTKQLMESARSLHSCDPTEH